MTEPQDPDRARRFSTATPRQHQAERLWRAAGYSAELIERLQWDRRYSIVRLGTVEFAFSQYSTFVAALREAWAANVVPDHGASSVRGIDLPKAARSLRGVDVELSEGPPGSRPERHGSGPRR